MINTAHTISRVAISTGALALMTLAAVLTGCVDQPSPTQPRSFPDRPHFGVGDVIMVTNTSGGTALGSLRWAIGLVTGGEIIRFDPSIAGATIVLDSTAVVKPGTTAVTIEGPADKGITVSGGGKWRVFDLQTSGPTVLRNLTIRDGFVAGPAAGILGSVLTLDHVTVANNHADGYNSAINAQRITLSNSTVSGNTATEPFESVILSSSVLGWITLVNSTVAFNSGRAIVSNNRTLENSILAENGGSNCDVPVGITYKGKNLSDDTSCGDINVMLIGDAKLDSLRDNGGPTPTHAFDPSSPVLNAGQNCSVTVDQRYAPRDAQCDIGAFEFLDYTQVTLTVDGSTSVNQSNGWAVVTGTVTCTRDGSFGLKVRLTQQQKARREQTVVDGDATIPIDCTTSMRPWSASVVPSGGTFLAGSGQVSAETVNAPAWVTNSTASSPVRLFWARR